MIVDFLYYTTLAIVSTYAIGLIYEFINKKNSSTLQKAFGWKGYCLICSVGTIVHELSHLVAAVLFLHTPTKVELFRPVKGLEDGILGRVEHSYKKTYLRMAGNFFIGCAPMVSGSFLSIMLFKLINIDLSTVWSYIITLDSDKMFSLIKNIDYKNPITYIILFVTISIVISMNMSKADIKNSIIGILPMYVVVFCLYLYLKIFEDVEQAALIFESMIIGYVKMLLFGILISIIILAINKIIEKIVSFIK